MRPGRRSLLHQVNIATPNRFVSGEVERATQRERQKDRDQEGERRKGGGEEARVESSKRRTVLLKDL